MSARRRPLVGRKLSPSALYGVRAEHIRPVHDYLLVQMQEPGKTSGGIHLPEGHSDDAPLGKVLAVGPGHFQPTDGARRPMCCEVGDDVLCPGGVTVIPGTTPPLALARDRDVACIVNRGEAKPVVELAGEN